MSLLSESMKTEESRIRAAYARRESVSLDSRLNSASLFMMQERERCFLRVLFQQGTKTLENKKILEIGCGSGDLLREFVRWGARPENVTGIELLHDRTSQARHLCPSTMRITEGNAAKLDHPHQAFDLVVQSTVFTSVLDSQMKKQMASEMLRVLKPDGLVLWYDFYVNNPHNPDVRGVTRREIRFLFPGCRIQLQRITLAPPITRLLAPYSWLSCYLLSKIPWFCTHYLGVIKKTQIVPSKAGKVSERRKENCYRVLGK